MSTLSEILHMLWIEMKGYMEFHTRVSLHHSQGRKDAIRQSERTADPTTKGQPAASLYTFLVLTCFFYKAGKMQTSVHGKSSGILSIRKK